MYQTKNTSILYTKKKKDTGIYWHEEAEPLSLPIKLV